jgi:hypothetical protein
MSLAFCNRHFAGYAVATGCPDCNAMSVQKKVLPPVQSAVPSIDLDSCGVSDYIEYAAERKLWNVTKWRALNIGVHPRMEMWMISVLGQSSSIAWSETEVDTQQLRDVTALSAYPYDHVLRTLGVAGREDLPPQARVDQLMDNYHVLYFDLRAFATQSVQVGPWVWRNLQKGHFYWKRGNDVFDLSTERPAPLFFIGP